MGRLLRIHTDSAQEDILRKFIIIRASVDPRFERCIEKASNGTLGTRRGLSDDDDGYWFSWECQRLRDDTSTCLGQFIRMARGAYNREARQVAFALKAAG